MVRLVRGVFAVLFLSILACASAHAQFSGNVQGVVTDPTGAPVPGAAVTLRETATGVSRSMKTSPSGNYSFSNLSPGSYVVSTSAKGFKTSEITLTLGTSEHQTLNVSLALPSVAQTVTVVSKAPPLNLADTRLQTTLSSTMTQELPKLNRNLWDVLAVQPGVVGTGTRGAGESPGGGADNFGTQTPAISANGRSYTGNVVFVDGMNVTSPIQNGNVILAPIPDAVQSASLQTNSFSAEDNLGSSVLVQLTTKSGTNQFHGSADLLYTDQNFDARQEFNPVVAPYQRKDLAATFGGPIIKNKLFFFSDVEKLWAKVPESTGTALWDAPELDAWAAQNFPSNVGTLALKNYPATFLHSTGVAATAANYLGNACTSGTTFNYTAPNGNSATIPCSLPVLDQGSFVFSPYYNALQYNFRVDYYFTQRDRLYLSYYNDSFDQQQPAPRSGLQAVDIMRNRYGQIDYTHTFTPNLLLEGAFAFASVGGANGQPVPGQNLEVPQIGINDGSQGFSIGGGWGPGAYRGPNYNWQTVLSWVHGAHTFKFGYQQDHAIEHGDFTPVNVRPNFSFNNLFDLVLDSPINEGVGAYNPLTGNAGYVLFGGQTNPFGFFAEDDWQAKPNLTLTLSLRWDDFTNHTPWGNVGCGAPVNSCFRFSDIVLGPGSTIQQRIAGASVKQQSNGLFSSAQTNYWSPRIGIAWDPTGHGRWVVRGGIGVYRDWVVLGQSVDQMRNNPPSVLSETFTAGGSGVQPDFAFGKNPTYPFDFPLPAIGAITLNAAGGYAGLPTSIDSLAPNLVPPLAVNYVLGVDHLLPDDFVVSASYSGSRSYDALTGSDWNRCAGCGVNNRPNPNFGSMVYVTNSNRATYNALIVAVRKSAASRGSFQASYTLSHAQDFPEAGTRFDQDAGLGIPSASSYFSYWGNANWDVRQRFSFSGLYNLPGMRNGFGSILTKGWAIGSIMAIQTGTPFWVTCNSPSCDYNNDGTYYDVPNAPTQSFTFSRLNYQTGIFKATAFPAPASGTEGNLARNIYRNPGMVEVDATLLKDTHVPWLGDAGDLQLRFEFLNLLNHVNLGPVDSNMADTTFGRVTTSLPARELEMAARVSF